MKVTSLLYVMALAAQTSYSKPTSYSSADQSANESNQQPAALSQDTYMNYVKQQQQQNSPAMQVHKLSSAGNNVTCNDGSQIGYYKRLNQHSKSWVIFLQGGGFCGSRASCRQRWHRTPFLMSSKYWPNTKTVDGILSSDPKENPYLWNANHIYVPYCSSDSWTGSAPATSHHEHTDTENENNNNNNNNDDNEQATRSSREPNSFAFLGSKIVERIFESLYDDLPLRQSLYDAKFILLAGDSAGATGVILNLDKIATLVEKRANYLKSNCSQNNEQCELKQSNPVLRGLADSGWFLDNEPYNFELEFGDPTTTTTTTSSGSGSLINRRNMRAAVVDCDRGLCTPLQSIKQAMQLWNGQVPELCLQSYVSEPWRCYFGYRAYQTLRTPLFVVQWLYDEAQLMVDNIVRPGTNGQWSYVSKVVSEMRTSLENVTALFAPSCLSHSLIARKSWNQININGFRLPHILNSWEEQPLLLETTPTGSAISAASLVVNSKMLVRGATPSSGIIINQPTFEAVLVEQEPPASSQLTTATIVGPTSVAANYLRSADRFVSAQESRNQTMTDRQTAASSGGAGNGQAKSRSRKRKRNQQQQNKIKQAGRQRSNNQQQQQQQSTTTTTQSGSLDSTFTTTSTNGHAREAIDSQQQQQSAGTLGPIQDLLQPPPPLMDRSLSSSELLYGHVNRAASDQMDGSAIRLGRSTIVEDATLMLSNNVPDDGGGGGGGLMSRMSMSQLSAATVATHTSSQDQSSWSMVESRSHGLNYGAYATSSSRDSASFGPDQFRFIDSCDWPQCNRDCPVLTYEFLLGTSVQF